VKDAIDQWTLDQLSAYLNDAELRYQERLLTEERGGRWVAELAVP
jgi:hypothetical protein